MREILFRGKRIDNGEWVEGSFLLDGEAHRPLNKEHIPFSNCYIVPETDMENIKTAFNDGSYCLQIAGYHVIHETVGQYTGLTDKNGKKVFENDIVVICYETDGEEFSETKRVHYNEKECCWYPMRWEECCEHCDHYTEVKSIEVIGNIHDNPDLRDEK